VRVSILVHALLKVEVGAQQNWDDVAVLPFKSTVPLMVAEVEVREVAAVVTGTGADSGIKVVVFDVTVPPLVTTTILYE